MNKITSEQIKSIAKAGEGYNAEFKVRVPSKVKELSLEVCAFANSEGGYLLASGIPRMQEAMKEAGLPEPIFSMDESFFTVEFKRPQKNDSINSSDDPINDPTNSQNDPTNSQNDPTNLEDVVFRIISNGEGISAPEISKLISKSLKTTKRYIAKLRESGKIEFRGALKTGGYYLINKD